MFCYCGGMLCYEVLEWYFYLCVCLGVVGLYEMWVVFGGYVWEIMEVLFEESLLLCVMGMNGLLLCKGLREVSFDEFVISL